jgi:hypothetical protein
MAHYADQEREAENQEAQEGNRFKSYAIQESEDNMASTANPHAQQMIDAGVKAEDITALTAAQPNINWGNVWLLIQKYGPGILGEILKLFPPSPPTTVP